MHCKLNDGAFVSQLTKLIYYIQSTKVACIYQHSREMKGHHCHALTLRNVCYNNSLTNFPYLIEVRVKFVILLFCYLRDGYFELLCGANTVEEQLQTEGKKTPSPII